MNHIKINYTHINEDEKNLIHLSTDDEKILCGIDQDYDLDKSDYKTTNEKINCPNCISIINICKNLSPNEIEHRIEEGALARQQSVDQIKRIQKISGNTDIGKRLSGDSSKPTNTRKVDTYEKFMKKAKKFKKKCKFESRKIL